MRSRVGVDMHRIVRIYFILFRAPTSSMAEDELPICRQLNISSCRMASLLDCAMNHGLSLVQGRV